MNGNIYGSASSASMNPKIFMIQALKKVILNNGNVIKFYNGDEEDSLKERMIRLRLANSEALVEEMKKHLNAEEENEAIKGVWMNFDWLLKEFKEIEEYIKGMSDDLQPPLEEKMGNCNYIVKNLLEGFEGMKDSEEDK